MPSNSSKKSKQRARPRRKSGPKRPKNRPKRAPAMNSKHLNAICAITNPFCPAANGAKYPDASSVKTLAWHSETYKTISTDASGRGAAYFGIDPGSSINDVLTWTGASMVPATVGNNNVLPGWSNWAAVQGVQYRVVSAGLQVRSILSAMNSQGSFGIAVVPANSTTITIVGEDLDSQNFARNQRQSCSTPGELSAVSHSDGITSKSFKYSQGNSAFGTSYGNDVLAAYIVGGPASSAALQVRWVVNYELSFGNTTVFNNVATPAAQDNPLVVSGSNFVKRSVDQIIVGGTKAVENAIMNAAMNFGRSAFTGLGYALGGPAGGMAANMIMDVD